MKKISLLLLPCLFLLLSCTGNEDTRFFAPEVEFGQAQYTAQAESGGLDVSLQLSRPAPMPFQIGLNFSGSLREGVHFTVPSHTLSVSEGDTQVPLHIDLIEDEIWEEESWIGISIAPGSRYTVDPEGKCLARIAVSKTIVLPLLRLSAPEGGFETNPFKAETLQVAILADKASSTDLRVRLALDGMAVGTDCLIDGETASEVILPAGEQQVSFDLSVLQKDESGYDRHATLSLVREQGAYGVSEEGASVDIHLYDPVVDFSPIWQTKALNNGTGFQLRQAIQTPEGDWSGNLAADFYVSSEGSNYLRNFRNMYDSAWSCRANSPGGNALRLTEFFPKYARPNDIIILDYGNAANTRTFAPVDSLMRFVLDKGETRTGEILLTKPRTFVALIGSYTLWQADVTGGKAWQVDSRATGGDLFASTHEALTGRVEVKLVRLEGRFDMDAKQEQLQFTAWFECDDASFMEDVDLTALGITRDGDAWKVNYKLWPR